MHNKSYRKYVSHRNPLVQMISDDFQGYLDIFRVICQDIFMAFKSVKFKLILNITCYKCKNEVSEVVIVNPYSVSTLISMFALCSKI